MVITTRTMCVYVCVYRTLVVWKFFFAKRFLMSVFLFFPKGCQRIGNGVAQWQKRWLLSMYSQKCLFSFESKVNPPNGQPDDLCDARWGDGHVGLPLSGYFHFIASFFSPLFLISFHPSIAVLVSTMFLIPNFTNTQEPVVLDRCWEKKKTRDPHQHTQT